MSENNSTAKEIDLGNGFGDVAVKANGTRVEMHAGGSVAAYTQKDVDAYTNGAVHVHQAANDSWTLRDKDEIVGEGRIVELIGDEPQIGDPDDGGIYVGLSASDGKPLHAALADEREYKTYGGALEAAEKLKSLHPSAHVPTPNELDQNLFANRNTGALKGTFNTSGSFPAGVYRSSASYSYFDARVQYFVVGGQSNLTRSGRLPVRLVW
jgi:hypothetical protein